MVDYSKGQIYKLVSDKTNLVYYGSTCRELRKRFYNHKSRYNLHLEDNNNRYFTSYEIFKFGNCKIVLVEKYPCNDKAELFSRERYYIENNDCVNKKIPGRSKKEYRQENKEKIAEQGKTYREENKEKIAQGKKKYAEKDRARSKLYYETNKERINKNLKEKATEESRLSKKEYDKERFKSIKKDTCICGLEIKSKGMKPHLKNSCSASLPFN
jgi:hypothetical protein